MTDWAAVLEGPSVGDKKRVRVLVASKGCRTIMEQYHGGPGRSMGILPMGSRGAIHNR